MNRRIYALQPDGYLLPTAHRVEVAHLSSTAMLMHGLIVLMRFGRLIFLVKDKTKHCHNNYEQIPYNIEFIQGDSKKT